MLPSLPIDKGYVIVDDTKISGPEDTDMTVPGKGETNNTKKGHRSLPTTPTTATVTIPLNLHTAGRAHSLAVSMLPTPTRVILKAILKALLQILLKLWRWASSFVVLIFLAAWFYGGFLPYFLFVVALLSLGYSVSDYLLYQPDFPLEARIFVPTPDQYGMPFEEIWIQTKDRVKLHAYLIKQMVANSRSVPTIIFLHGNAGNIGSRLENALLLFKEVRCHILLLEYRGYGHSEGTPTESGLYMDSQAAFEYIDAREDLDSKKIILFGRSLGGAVAVDLASRCDFRDRIAGIVVENSFTSIPAVAKHLFPLRIVRWLPRFCYKNKFESINKVTSVVCPSLFIAGTEDEMIPEFMMTELYTKCSSTMKRLIRFPGGHNDTWACDKNYPINFSEFISDALKVEKSPNFRGTYSDNIV